MPESTPDNVSVDLSGVINLPAATEDKDGLVELAGIAETQAGVDNTQAITPASAAATYVAFSDYTTKGDLLVASSESNPSALPLGSNGQVLTVDSSHDSGVKWATPVFCHGTVTAISSGNGLCGGTITSCGTLSLNTSCVIAPTALSARGDLLTASGPGAPVALPVGGNGQVLRANSSCALGLEWSSIGKTTSILANPGVVALEMDNLRVCFNSTGNRTWAFATVCGTEPVTVQTTSANCAVLSTQRRVSTLNSTTFTELGWNFACSAACATYMICMGPSTAPTAIYCFVGMVGCSYTNNLFNLTRLY